MLCLPAHAQEGAGDQRGRDVPLLRPIKLVSATGDVQNAEALIKGQGGVATLTMVDGGPRPAIVLDYGRDQRS
jgi:hypothetical protein